MDSSTIQTLAGGFATTTSGGSRTSIKLSRPWQTPFPIDPDNCPFCNEVAPKPLLRDNPPGWRIRDNKFTPHKHHRLIVADKCWGENMLQTLGGYEKIREVMNTANKATIGESTEFALFVHIGNSAGQNLGHIHWHLMEVAVRKPLSTAIRMYEPELLVHEQNGMSIFATGTRAGECLTLSKNKKLEFGDNSIPDIAATIDWIVSVGNNKFRSVQGRTPDFSVTVRISKYRKFRYANYCPILNMFGAPENVIAPLEGGPITLPWPHKITAEYLRD
jgi:hypothetical protein